MSKYKKFRYTKANIPLSGPLCTAEGSLSKDSLTASQREAESIFRDWFYSPKTKKNQILRIGGPGGVGKDFLIRYLIENYDLDLSNCFVMAYTGQAVNVMRKNYIMARTIHSSIMIPREERVLDSKTGEVITRHGIPLTKVTFKPVKALPSTLKLIIINEASFLPEKLEQILVRYGVPILEIGDPIQLPPVADTQVFTMDKLDYFMEGVMRQNRDSEIYQLANLLRNHKNIYPQEYRSDVRFLFSQPTLEETFYRYLPFFKAADMIVTGTNKQRQIICDLYRKEIIQTKSPFPVKGERLICRQNNWELSLGQFMLTNGTQGVCMNTVGHSDHDKRTRTFTMNFKPDVVADDPELYFDNLVCDEEYLHRPFESSRQYSYRQPGEKFQFAYAITCHLCQGGQAPNVLFLDTFSYDLDYISRLRYTAVTRAQKNLWYILPYSQYPGWTELTNMERRWKEWEESCTS